MLFNCTVKHQETWGFRNRQVNVSVCLRITLTMFLSGGCVTHSSVKAIIHGDVVLPTFPTPIMTILNFRVFTVKSASFIEMLLFYLTNNEIICEYVTVFIIRVFVPGIRSSCIFEAHLVNWNI